MNFFFFLNATWTRWCEILNRPGRWRLQKIVPKTELQFLDHLSYLFLCPAPECSRDQKEWVRFLKYLQKNNMVHCCCSILMMFVICLRTSMLSPHHPHSITIHTICFPFWLENYANKVVSIVSSCQPCGKSNSGCI